jgi:hypothetical protein
MGGCSSQGGARTPALGGLGGAVDAERGAREELCWDETRAREPTGVVVAVRAEGIAAQDIARVGAHQDYEGPHGSLGARRSMSAVRKNRRRVHAPTSRPRYVIACGVIVCTRRGGGMLSRRRAVPSR